MNEFPVAWCPGPECVSKVRIWPGGINMCCSNCWSWSAYWSGLNGGSGVPVTDAGEPLPPHSEACAQRQEQRRDWGVTEGVFGMVNVTPPSERHLREGKSRK